MPTDAVPVDLPEHLPDILREHRKDMAAAFQRPMLGAWPEDTHYTDAPQPAAIGDVLIEAVHTHLANARLGVVFRESMKRRDRVRLASVSRANAKLIFFANIDFLIEVNWTAWCELTGAQRIALMDHELCHCGRDDDTYVLVSHDLEEFGAIITRWGLWRPDVEAFARIIHQQGDLFRGAP